MKLHGGPSIRTPPSMCPHCGKLLDSARSANGNPPRQPAEGDYTLCMLGCGGISRVGATFQLEPLTDAEVLSADLKPADLAQMLEVQAAVRRHLKLVGRGPNGFAAGHA